MSKASRVDDGTDGLEAIIQLHLERLRDILNVEWYGYGHARQYPRLREYGEHRRQRSKQTKRAD